VQDEGLVAVGQNAPLQTMTAVEAPRPSHITWSGVLVVSTVLFGATIIQSGDRARWTARCGAGARWTIRRVPE